MPVVTSCPDCARKLRVPDELLGKKVRCPGCKVVFTASADSDNPEPAPPPPPPRRSAPPRDERIEQDPRPRRAPPREEDDANARDQQGDEEQDFLEEEDDLPRGRRLHEDDEYGEDVPRAGGSRAVWLKVASGLTWVLISIGLAIVLGFCGGIGGGIIGGVTAANAAAARPPGPGPVVVAAPAGAAFFVLMLTANLLGVVTKGVDLYGKYLGMAVPNKPGTGLRTLAVTTFGLFVPAALLTILASFLSLALGLSGGFLANPFAGAGAGAGAAIAVGGLNVIGLLCYLAGYVVFILYLRAVAIAVKRKDLGRLLKAFLITLVSLGAIGIVLGGIMLAVIGASVTSAAVSAPAPGAGGNAVLGGALATMGLLCLGGLVGLGLSIWYIVLLVQVRGAVLNFARRG